MEYEQTAHTKRRKFLNKAKHKKMTERIEEEEAEKNTNQNEKGHI